MSWGGRITLDWVLIKLTNLIKRLGVLWTLVYLVVIGVWISRKGAGKLPGKFRGGYGGLGRGKDGLCWRVCTLVVGGKLLLLGFQ